MPEKSFISNVFNLLLLALLTLVIALSVTLLVSYEDFFMFLEKNLASDQKIANPDRVVFILYLQFAAAALTVFLLKGALNYAARHKIRFSQIALHKKVFYLGALLLILVSVLFHRVKFLYQEDGLLENLTALLAFASGIIFIHLGTRYINKIRRVFMYLLAGVTILFALEEISWGQRIFGLQTPEYFMKNNVQQESNLHNFFNEHFDLAYLILCTILCAIFFYRDQLIALFRKFWMTKFLVPLFPGERYFYTGFIFLFLMLFTLNIEKGGETLEVSIALFVFFYAYEMLQKADAVIAGNYPAENRPQKALKRSAAPFTRAQGETTP